MNQFKHTNKQKNVIIFNHIIHAIQNSVNYSDAHNNNRFSFECNFFLHFLLPRLSLFTFGVKRLLHLPKYNFVLHKKQTSKPSPDEEKVRQK